MHKNKWFQEMERDMARIEKGDREAMETLRMDALNLLDSLPGGVDVNKLRKAYQDLEKDKGLRFMLPVLPVEVAAEVLREPMGAIEEILNGGLGNLTYSVGALLALIEIYLA